MFTDYQIALISPTTGALLDILDAARIINLRYTRKLNDAGKFVLTISAGDRAANLRMITNLIIDIYRRNDPDGDMQREDTYFLRAFTIMEENGKDYVVLSGDHVLSLFRDRLILPEDDPLGANGFSTKFGLADLVMYEYVGDQIINPAVNLARAEPVTNAPSQNLGQPIFQRKGLKDTLLKTLIEASTLGRVDFRLTRANGASFLFEVGIFGRNLTYTANYPSSPFLLFKPEFGNMRNPEFVVDYSQEINVVFVGTRGIEEDRAFTPVTTPNSFAPFNRREGTTDAREIEDDTIFNAINTAGYEFLREKEPVVKFIFGVETTISKYNEDWFLGDRLTAQYQDYREDLRVIEVEISIEGDDETIKPIFQKEIL